MKDLVLYIHGKGGSAGECEHWFHTEEQLRFLDEWMLSLRASTIFG